MSTDSELTDPTLDLFWPLLATLGDIARRIASEPSSSSAATSTADPAVDPAVDPSPSPSEASDGSFAARRSP